jgi:hypothetical protein
MASGPKDKSSRDESRRDFMKGAVGTLVVGATLVGSRGEAHAQEANRRAVLPDGKAYTRPELLQRLGLDPNTPPEAWISITKCGTNAGALKPGDAQRLLDAGKIDRKQLSPEQQQELKIQPGKATEQGLKTQPQAERGLKIRPQQIEGEAQ